MFSHYRADSDFLRISRCPSAHSAGQQNFPVDVAAKKRRAELCFLTSTLAQRTLLAVLIRHLSPRKGEMPGHTCCGGLDGPTPAQDAVPAADVPVLTPGDRIEVLWIIERNDEDDDRKAALASTANAAPSESEERWWGARVLLRDGESTTYTLQYDAYKEFPSAEVDVSLVGPHTLRDRESGGDVMRWKIEGTEFEEEDDANCTVSMRDIVAAQEEVDAEEGEVAGDVMMAALNTLPVLQQTELALKYRSFADELKSELSKLTSERGPGHIVNEADIQALFAKIRDAS
jgi:hypothetical protein